MQVRLEFFPGLLVGRLVTKYWPLFLPLFINLFFPVFFSVVYFFHRRSAQSKNLFTTS